MSTKDLTEKVRSLKELEALITEAQAEAESIKDELKAEMINRNTEEMMVDVFKIRYKTVKSNRFDTTALRVHIKNFTTSTSSRLNQEDLLSHKRKSLT